MQRTKAQFQNTASPEFFNQAVLRNVSCLLLLRSTQDEAVVIRPGIQLSAPSPKEQRKDSKTAAANRISNRNDISSQTGTFRLANIVMAWTGDTANANLING